MAFVNYSVTMAAVAFFPSLAIISITSNCVGNGSIGSSVSPNSSVSSFNYSLSSLFCFVVEHCSPRLPHMGFFRSGVPDSFTCVWKNDLWVVSARRIMRSGSSVAVTTFGFDLVEQLSDICSSCLKSLSCFCVLHSRLGDQWKTTDWK